MIAIFVLLLIILFYLWCIKPNTKRKNALNPYKEVYIAHRGLFNNLDLCENSFDAFQQAVNHGYGIELDIQLTKDNQLVVFHDTTLKRMCNDSRTLNQLTYKELQQLYLLDTKQQIPLFEDVLKMVHGQVVMIVEIKGDGRYLETAKKVYDLIKNYQGIYCIESFNPLVMQWFKKHHPEIIRGQLSMNYFIDQDDTPLFLKFVLTHLLINFLSRPDFIAYDHRYTHLFSYKLCRKLFKPINVCWTIKNQEQLEQAKNTYDIFIFDSFIPK